jgi:hypothetical protein
VANSLFNIGAALFKMGNFQEALSIYQQSYGPDHPDVKNVQDWIAMVQKK